MYKYCLLFLFLLITGCGFNNKASLAVLPAIKIGQFTCPKTEKFRCLKAQNALRALISAPQLASPNTILESELELNLSLEYAKSSSAVRSDKITVRNKVAVTVDYQLISSYTKQNVCKGSLQNIGSIQVAHSPYINFLSEEEMVDKTIIEIIYLLKMRIAQCLAFQPSTLTL